MLGRLIQKELANYLLDFRFVAVFALCILLSALSVYVGGQNYVRQLKEYTMTAENQRSTLQTYIDEGNLFHFQRHGYRWSRRPETLSPVVYGLSGKLGQEVHIHYQRLPRFEASLFEGDPAFALFGVLDLAFIVRVVLALVALLFTYDAICGEKEDGTLRLYASFPVSRSTIALSKLAGAAVAVLAPFLFAFLLAAAVLSVFPGIDMQAQEWMRVAVLVGVFGLYLAVFAAFGVWASALAHRKMAAFLALLGLWAVWVFIVPEAAVRVARRLAPAESSVELQKLADNLLWEVEKEKQAARVAFSQQQQAFQQEEIRDYLKRRSVKGLDAILAMLEAQKDWGALTEERKKALLAGWQRIPKSSLQAWREALEAVRERNRPRQREAYAEAGREIDAKWDDIYYNRLARYHEAHRNQLREQQALAKALSAISPFSAVTFASMDLARTGYVQKDRTEDALAAHLVYLAEFLRKKTYSAGRNMRGVDIGDFSPFIFQDRETLAACLSRNGIHLLSLALLAVLGFVGAYVAILRYDVR